MTTAKTLYAWAVPAYFSESPVDHTWVTTYDNRTTVYPDIVAVTQASQHLWYCWGDFHPAGGMPINPTGALGSQPGNIALASRLVLPDQDSETTPAARGTIFVYGVDGVCHRLANQVLFSTGSPGHDPLTVKNASGYFASSLLYGTYGTLSGAGADKIAACAGLSHLRSPIGGEGR